MFSIYMQLFLLCITFLPDEMILVDCYVFVLDLKSESGLKML